MQSLQRPWNNHLPRLNRPQSINPIKSKILVYNLMNKQNLSTFSEQQLERYLSTFKLRVSEMRQLTVDLEKQNVQLSAEYTGLVNKKKILHEESIKRKNLLLKWYDSGRKSMNGWMSKLKKEEKNSYEPQLLQNQEPSPTRKNNEDEISEVTEKKESEKKTIFSSSFNFDDLYLVGKEKLGKIITQGETKFRQLTKKYQSSKEATKSESVEKRQHPNHEISEFKHETAAEHSHIANLKPVGEMKFESEAHNEQKNHNDSEHPSESLDQKQKEHIIISPTANQSINEYTRPY